MNSKTVIVTEAFRSPFPVGYSIKFKLYFFWMSCAFLDWITLFFMSPGRTPAPTAPGCTSDFPQRRNGSAPAGADSETGTAFNHATAKRASALLRALRSSQAASLCLFPAC